MNEWISFKDKLPKINLRVLMVDSGGDIFVGALSRSLDCDVITHWMPLPELPKINL